MTTSVGAVFGRQLRHTTTRDVMENQIGAPHTTSVGSANDSWRVATGLQRPSRFRVRGEDDPSTAHMHTQTGTFNTRVRVGTTS
jgi:hypothetical protein